MHLGEVAKEVVVNDTLVELVRPSSQNGVNNVQEYPLALSEIMMIDRTVASRMTGTVSLNPVCCSKMSYSISCARIITHQIRPDLVNNRLLV